MKKVCALQNINPLHCLSENVDQCPLITPHRTLLLGRDLPAWADLANRKALLSYTQLVQDITKTCSTRTLCVVAAVLERGGGRSVSWLAGVVPAPCCLMCIKPWVEASVCYYQHIMFDPHPGPFTLPHPNCPQCLLPHTRQPSPCL